MGIPKGITKEHVLSALAAFDAGEPHEFGESTRYDLVHNGRMYPPKAVVGIAAKFVVGQPLHPSDFSGGEGAGQANAVLEALGFDVVKKATAGTNAYILTWNSDKWTWANYDQHILDTKNGKTVDEPWTTHNKGIAEGDRLFLLRQGEIRGLIGAGRAASDCFFGDSEVEGQKSEKVRKVLVRFDVLLSDDEVLPTETLIENIAEVKWKSIYASGQKVPAECVGGLETLWQAHLESIGRVGYKSPDEVNAASHYKEGATKQVTVNAYERNPEARKACIAHYGTACTVCGFDFGKVYGELGEGFTHVHHLRDLATIGQEYEVNPIEDLRPVCPNCHAMLHRQVPAMSTEELQGRISLQQRDGCDS
jgi:5-methylcytosine-specific restriction protein A